MRDQLQINMLRSNNFSVGFLVRCRVDQLELNTTFVWTLGSFMSDSRFTLLNWSSLLDLKSRYLMGSLLQNIDKVECNEGKVAIKLHLEAYFVKLFHFPTSFQVPNEQVYVHAYEFQIFFPPYLHFFHPTSLSNLGIFFMFALQYRIVVQASLLVFLKRNSHLHGLILVRTFKYQFRGNFPPAHLFRT